jgi:hypothetical protein
LTEEYTHAAARGAADPKEPLYVVLNQYIGAGDQTPPPELAELRTLHELVDTVQKYLKQVSGQLDNRFKQFAHPDDRHIPRRQPLSTGWNHEIFDKKIEEALIDHPLIGMDTSPSSAFRFNWAKLEKLVVDRLKAGEPNTVLNQAADLFEHWLRRRANPEQIRDVMERIANACLELLKGDGRHGGLKLRDVQGGNAVDLLASMPEVERKTLIDQMVKASAPFLPIRSHHMISELRLSYSNLYGRNAAEPGNDDTIRALVQQELRRLDPGMPSDSINPLTAVDSSLVMVREVAGFPLQYYTRLETLRDAYNNTGTFTKNNNECHIDYRFSMRDLPDICALDIPTYARIREHVPTILRSIIIGDIAWEDSEFRVRVQSPFAGARAYGLGTKFDRMIKYSCDTEEIRKHLVDRWKKWSAAATPKGWACLFAAALKTYRLIEDRVTHLDQMHTESPPLSNCYHQLLIESKVDLEKVEDGPRWSAALMPMGPSGSAGGNARLERSYLDTLAEQVLRPVREGLPIYQVLADRVDTIEPPFAPEPVAP